MSPDPVTLSPDQARRLLLATVGPTAHTPVDGPVEDQVTHLVDSLRHVQIDPIDRVGTNHDLVAMARLDGLQRRDVHHAHGFEHFAKERCLLPASAFPHYRAQARRTPLWRHTSNMKALDDRLLDAVEAEVHARGPLTPARLGEHGDVTPTDWSGWTGTGKAGTLALHTLAMRCRLVVTGREGGQRVYDTPERALPQVASTEPDQDFAAWLIPERAAAAGLLATASGPWWGMLKQARTDGTVDTLVEEGVLTRVHIAGSRRRWLARTADLDRPLPADDGRMRILGPLDPLLWNRALVELVFGFTYVWEVYVPKARRRWGYYVTPLLHGGRLVGRAELRVDKDSSEEGELLRVERLWWEDGAPQAHGALENALERHAGQLGCVGVVGPDQARPSPTAPPPHPTV